MKKKKKRNAILLCIVAVSSIAFTGCKNDTKREETEDNIEKQITITVFLDEGITESRIKEIGDEISIRSEVDRIEYVSPEQAWAEFVSQYFEGKEYLVEEFKDDNPLANSQSYSVYLNEVAAQEGLVAYIEGIDGVRQVNRK